MATLDDLIHMAKQRREAEMQFMKGLFYFILIVFSFSLFYFVNVFFFLFSSTFQQGCKRVQKRSKVQKREQSGRFFLTISHSPLFLLFSFFSFLKGMVGGERSTKPSHFFA